MTTPETVVIDVADAPDLARLARDVARDGRPRVIREGGKDLAVLSPASGGGRRRVTQADIDAALATFGRWKDRIDAEQFLAEVREARGDHRPDVSL